MKFTDIDRSTKEGELLVSAVNLLQHYIGNGNVLPSTQQVFEEVLQHYDNRSVIKSNGGCVSTPLAEPFTVALRKAIQEKDAKDRAEAKELSDASNIVLKHAAPSSSPDQFNRLEAALVDLYRYRFSV